MNNKYFSGKILADMYFVKCEASANKQRRIIYPTLLR